MINGNFKNINFGFYHAVGIDHSDVMHSWGRNTFGQASGSEKYYVKP
jgi:alpha-tubulin suppressor-like RCC1 family protein